MKSRLVPRSCLFLGIAAFNFALLPALRAQNTQVTPQNPTGTEADSKTPNSSTAQDRNASTGTGATAASSPDTTNSKDTTNSLDKSPSTASTDSANQAATKDPSDTNPAVSTTDEKMAGSDSEKPHRFSDRHFLVKAAEGGMTEVQLGQLAQQNASSSDVKEFGAMMVKDHSQANDELKGIAQQKGVAIPSKLNAHDQATYDSLSKLSGPAFDRAYVNDMVSDHKKDVAEFKRASQSTQDPDVKNFADKTLTVIQDHLTHAQSLQSQIK